MKKYMCIKCGVFDDISKFNEIFTGVNTSFYVCDECINSLGKRAVFGHDGVSPQLNKQEVK